MKYLICIFVFAAGLSVFGQTYVRYDASYPSISAQFPPTLVANVPPNSPTIAVCTSPANAVPCTNYQTTYTGQGNACPNGAQDTPQPNALTSACQPISDPQGNIGFWLPSTVTQVDYTVCISNNCFGPYTVTLGGGSGGGGSSFPPPAPATAQFPASINVAGTTTTANLTVTGQSNLNGLNTTGQINVNPPVNPTIGFLPDPIVPYTVPSGDAQLGALTDPNNGCVEMAWNDGVGTPNINQFPLLLNKLPSYSINNSYPVWNSLLCGFDLVTGAQVQGVTGNIVSISSNYTAQDSLIPSSQLVRKDTANTFLAPSTLDLSGTTGLNPFRVPVNSGFGPSVAGSLGVNTGSHNFEAHNGISGFYLALLPITTLTNGDCVNIVNSAGSISLADSGAACSGGGSGTVSANTGTTGSVAFYTSGIGGTTVGSSKIVDTGSYLEYSGTAGLNIPAGSTSTASLQGANATGANYGWYFPSGSSTCWLTGGTAQECMNTNGIEAGNSNMYAWSQASAATGTKNLGLSDDNTTAGLGVLDVGSGTAGSTTAKVKASAYMSVGTKFTTNAGCGESAGTTTGGGSAGKFTTAGSTSCTTIVTMGDTATAPNGWACYAHDLTTTADYNNPRVSSNATTATIVTGTIVSGDVIEFGCIGY